MTWSLVSWQQISLVGLIVGVYLFGVVPLLLGNTVSKAHIKLLCAFSGGVLIGTIVIHLFPEVAALASKFRCAVGIDSSYPIGELLICVGLVAVMIVENRAAEYEHVAHQVTTVSFFYCGCDGVWRGDVSFSDKTSPLEHLFAHADLSLCTLER